MSNALYSKYKQSMLSLNPSVDLDSDTIKVGLVSAGYAFSASHQYLNEINPNSNIVGTPQALASRLVVDGVFDAADVTYTAVTGPQVVALVLYKDTGVATTSPLIAFLDSVSVGLPVTPNGGDITVTWDNGANKIFRIS